MWHGTLPKKLEKVKIESSSISKLINKNIKTQMKIAVLGAGNMGLSFSKSFLKYELIKPKNLHLITRSQNKKEKIAFVAHQM